MFLTPDKYPPPHECWLDTLLTLPENLQRELISSIAADDPTSIMDDWAFKARLEQLPPGGDWFLWVLLGGRGMGKTTTGSNWLIKKHMLGEAKNSAIIAATAGDLNAFCLEGPAGILRQAPNYFLPQYIPSKSKLLWPNGSETRLYSSEKPDRLRSGNHDAAWCDEVSYWAKPDYVWDMLMFTLRIGVPQCVITMTPRPIRLVKKIVAREGDDAIITRGATHDNIANLSDIYIKKVIQPYVGTRLGRQEINGEILMDAEGALWNHAQLDECRNYTIPEFTKVSIAVDPATTNNDTSDECGIVAAGKDWEGRGYVLGDHSLKDTPLNWAKKAVAMYHHYKANDIVAEVNQGGDLVETVIHSIDSDIKVVKVHASRGKVARAEPVSALYEQGRVMHCGDFPTLEDEMCMFVPGELKVSPNRADALVWAITHLMIDSKRGRAGVWGS